MELSTLLDWSMLASIAVCIAVWPTQIISANQNRWLRIFTVTLCLVQLIGNGPRWQLLPAYLVILIFIVRLLPKKNSPDKSTNQESTTLTSLQWMVVSASALALLASIVLYVIYPSVEHSS